MRNYLPYDIGYKYRYARKCSHIASFLFQSSACSLRSDIIIMAIVLPSHFLMLDCHQDGRGDSTLFLTELGNKTTQRVQKGQLTEDLRQSPFLIQVRDFQSQTFD